MGKRLIILFVLAVMSIVVGCAENTDNSVSDMSSESKDSSVSDISPESTDNPSHIHDENAPLCMDKVLFVASLNHNGQMEKYNDADVRYYLVVMNDGNIFTMENNYESDNYEFSKKFGYRDDSAWSLVENLENIGSLSAEDTEKLSDYISEINPDSDYYDYERDNMGILPEVIPDIYYDYKFFIYNGSEKSIFKIMSGGEGVYYETYDKNALSAFKLITDNQIYIDWRNKF